jgi:hypothetical protein
MVLFSVKQGSASEKQLKLQAKKGSPDARHDSQIKSASTNAYAR